MFFEKSINLFLMLLVFNISLNIIKVSINNNKISK